MIDTYIFMCGIFCVVRDKFTYGMVRLPEYVPNTTTTGVSLLYRRCVGSLLSTLDPFFLFLRLSLPPLYPVFSSPRFTLVWPCLLLSCPPFCLFSYPFVFQGLDKDELEELKAKHRVFVTRGLVDLVHVRYTQTQKYVDDEIDLRI